MICTVPSWACANSRGTMLVGTRQITHRLSALSALRTVSRWQWRRLFYPPPRERSVASLKTEHHPFHPIQHASCSGSSTLFRRSRLMIQYEKIKEQYKDYILLFQVGDFYELYGEDASERGACVVSTLF